MMETQEQLERWLDLAMKEYADVQPREGFEQRVAQRLQKGQVRWGWALAPLAAAAVLATCILVWRSQPQVGAPPVLQAKVNVPALQRVEMHEPAQQRPRRGNRTPHDPRGAPLVTPGLSPQEQAILQMLRTSRATTMAALDNTGEEKIVIPKLENTPVGGEER